MPTLEDKLDESLSKSIAIRCSTGQTYEVMIMFDDLASAQLFHDVVMSRVKVLRERLENADADA